MGTVYLLEDKGSNPPLADGLPLQNGGFPFPARRHSSTRDMQPLRPAAGLPPQLQLSFVPLSMRLTG